MVIRVVAFSVDTHQEKQKRVVVVGSGCVNETRVGNKTKELHTGFTDRNLVDKVQSIQGVVLTLK